jgi:hypothetical protein
MATYRNAVPVAVGEGVGAAVVTNSVGVGVRRGVADATALGLDPHAASTRASKTRDLVIHRGYR